MLYESLFYSLNKVFPILLQIPSDHTIDALICISFAGVSANSGFGSLPHVGASVSRPVGAVGSRRARAHVRDATRAAAPHAGPAKPRGIGAHASARDHLAPRAAARGARAAAALDR